MAAACIAVNTFFGQGIGEILTAPFVIKNLWAVRNNDVQFSQVERVPVLGMSKRTIIALPQPYLFIVIKYAWTLREYI